MTGQSDIQGLKKAGECNKALHLFAFWFYLLICYYGYGITYYYLSHSLICTTMP